jgi:glycosyltransferase involved in cell wall biosynthesis
MRIGIDISQIVHEGTGVSTYTQELVRALLSIDKENKYVLFGASLRKLSTLKDFAKSLKGEAFEKFYPIPPTLAEPLFNCFPRPPIELFTGKLDVFHTSDWLEPRALCPKVSVVHDLAMFRFPEVAHPKILATHKRKLELVKKESRIVIAVSESTKKDLVEIMGFDPKKIVVIYEAAGSQFKPTLGKSKLAIDGKYLLTLGTREPRKNLRRVIEAFSRLHLPDVMLVIVGKFGWGEDIRPVENVIIAGYLPNEDLPSVYSNAEAFVYPTLYEGFGLPVLEAMSCGVPVVTSNVSSLPEVAGDAAILVDPNDSDAITSGIRQVLKDKDKLILKGYKQASKFSWEKTARQTLEVYNRAVKN